ETGGYATTTSNDRYGRDRDDRYGRDRYGRDRDDRYHRDRDYSRYSRDTYGYRGTSGEMFNIGADEGWVDTGIWVEAGYILSFDARGSAQLSNNGGDVSSPAGALSGRRAGNSPLRSAPAGALLARIGDGAPILIGNGRSLRAIGSGELFLGINDD